MQKGKMSVNIWILMTVVNAVVLYLASVLYPRDIVLGNNVLLPYISVVITAVLLSVVLSFTPAVAQALKIKEKNELGMGLSYTVANIIGLWVIARMAVFTGFGVSSYIIAVVLGLILSTVQYGVWKQFGGKKK